MDQRPKYKVGNNDHIAENKGTKPVDLSHREHFMNLTQKVREVKVKINKWDNIKLPSFCTPKEIANKTKKQTIEWETYLHTTASIRGLYPKYIKNSYNLIPNNPIKK